MCKPEKFLEVLSTRVHPISIVRAVFPGVFNLLGLRNSVPSKVKIKKIFVYCVFFLPFIYSINLVFRSKLDITEYCVFYSNIKITGSFLSSSSIVCS